MNIFFLDRDPVTAAQYHCDKHVVKMCVETAQIVCTAASLIGLGNQEYKSTHVGHPSVRWAAEHVRNLRWTVELGLALGKEYTHRYGRVHKSAEVVDRFAEANPWLYETEGSYSDPPMCMPDDVKRDSVVEAYRQYYVVHKKDMLTYTNRELPPWLSSFHLAVAKTKKI